MTFSGLREGPSLLLLATGPQAEVAARLAEAAPVLARELGLPLLPAPAPGQDPDQALAALAAAGSAAGLSWLGVDPGMVLCDGRVWAQVLGAWRQPALLLIGAGQLATGTAAATTALLQRHQVPLGGLIQWGEPWQPELRRRDGLPWLGPVGPLGQPEQGDLRLALALQGAVAG